MVALPAVLITPLSVMVGGVSLVVRFRRARGVERQQLRWVASAAVVAAAGIPLAMAGISIDSAAVVGAAVLGSAAVLFLAIAAAILRYRLYDLDRIISRTLAYGLLTLLLGLGYAAVVLGLGRLLPEGSSLVVAAATLAMAAVFQPARRRIQQQVDRRFNRRRHDAGQMIAAFGARLRHHVDLDDLTDELLTVVDQTMQPTRASLWLRPQAPANTARPNHPRRSQPVEPACGPITLRCSATPVVSASNPPPGRPCGVDFAVRSAIACTPLTTDPPPDRGTFAHGVVRAPAVAWT